jgi:hypothetical protein
MFRGQMPHRMSYLGPPADRFAPPKAAVSSPPPPFRVHGAGTLWRPTPRRRPRLANEQETAVKWVIIIEIWYKPVVGSNASREPVE